MSITPSINFSHFFRKGDYSGTKQRSINIHIRKTLKILKFCLMSIVDSNRLISLKLISRESLIQADF